MNFTVNTGAEMFAVPAWIIRGGTSKGVYLLESDLPEDRSLWGPYLIEMFGSRDARQIDGIGGAMPTSSKCCIVGPSARDDADVDYTFAQVGIGEEVVYWDFNCGNLTPSVGTYAILAGLVEPRPALTSVRIYQTNTRLLLTVDVPTSGDGAPLVDGDFEIAGVSGTGPAVTTDFSLAVGASLGGGLFPSENRKDSIVVPGIGVLECSIVDLGNMCVFFRAEDAGLTGLEMPAQGPEVVDTFIAVRRAAQAFLGIDPIKTTPWPVAIGHAQPFAVLGGEELQASDFDFTVRFAGIQPMRDTLHESYPGTASSCTAVAAVTPGTVVNELYTAGSSADGVVTFAHPSGPISLEAAVHEEGAQIVVDRVVYTRTVRPIMSGRLLLRRSGIESLLDRMPVDAPTRSNVPVAQYSAS